MYREFLINIIEESFEELPQTQAIKNINAWAIELYDHHNKKIWFDNLEIKEREQWGDYPTHSKQCPCGVWREDSVGSKHMSQKDWINEHYPHDLKFAEGLRKDEDQFLKERVQRKSIDKV